MFKKLIKIFIIILLIPYVLTVVYLVVPPVSLPVLGRFVSLQEVHWRWRNYHEISPSLPRALIAAEDGRFCEHHGVDWDAVETVIKDAERKDDFKRGASTIAMQTAKNLFLWPLPRFVRKPLEIPLAMWIDLIWPKHRVMEVYMNIAQFGNGVYGAEAASEIYFKKPASRLNSVDASILASVLPNPTHRNPAHPSAYMYGYAGTVSARSGKVAAWCVR